MSRQNISSGAPWESIVGYSRAVRIGQLVHVSGTVATDEAGAVVGNDNAYEQARFIYQKIGKALQAAGASFQDVISLRFYVIDIERDWEAIARANSEIFSEIRPAATMVQVSKLIAPEYLVEIEVQAVLSN